MRAYFGTSSRLLNMSTIRWMSMRAQAVLRAVLHEAAAGVDHEDALAGLGVRLVDHHDAGGDAGAVEEVRGQADDALDVALAHERAADVGLGVAAEQHAVRQNARAFAGALERADDVQQVGVVALPGGRRAERLEAIVGIVQRIDAVAPALVGERRIGDDEVESLEAVAVLELGIGQRVALHDQRGRVVVQDHVHSRQAAGGSVLFLPVQRDGSAGLVAHLQEQRAGTAGRVVDGRGGAGLRVVDADDLRHDAADFGGRVELPLALATLGGEVPHQVFVGVAEDVVALGAVLREVERRVLEDGNEVGEPVHHLLAGAKLGGVVEVGEVGELVGAGQRGDDLLVDLIADVGLALEGDHVLEAGARRDRDRGVGLARVLVADVLDEEQDEDVVLVLTGVHAAAQFVAAGPERGIELGFLEGHVYLGLTSTFPESAADVLPSRQPCDRRRSDPRPASHQHRGRLRTRSDSAYRGTSTGLARLPAPGQECPAAPEKRCTVSMPGIRGAGAPPDTVRERRCRRDRTCCPASSLRSPRP